MTATLSRDPNCPPTRGHKVSGGFKNPTLLVQRTYPQLWVVEIHTAHKHQLRDEALRQMPGPGDGHRQVVCDVSMYPTEGRREVSAVGQNERQ